MIISKLFQPHKSTVYKGRVPPPPGFGDPGCGPEEPETGKKNFVILLVF